MRFFVKGMQIAVELNLVLSQSILTFTNTDGTHNVLSSGVEIGTDVEYGAIHHFGGEIKFMRHVCAVLTLGKISAQV